MRAFPSRLSFGKAAMRLAAGVVLVMTGVAGASAEAGANEATAAAAPAAATPAAAAPSAAAREDYYTRRARETLEEDAKLAKMPPHPLALRYPNHTVVVCEAGCRKEGTPAIVFMEPRQPAQVAVESQMVPTSSGPVAAAAGGVTPDGAIDCIAGCYGATKRFRAPASLKGGVADASQPDAWLSTDTRKAKPDGPTPLRR